MNADIDLTMKQCATCLEYQYVQPHETALHYEIPCKSWHIVGAVIFIVNYKSPLCIVDYYNNYPAVKKVANLSVDTPVLTTKITFAEFRLTKKIISDV